MEFRQIYDEMYEPLIFFCYRYLNDTDEAKDVAQDCFIKLHQVKQNINDLNKVKSFLYKSAKNQSLNILRHRKVVGAYMEENKEENIFFENAITESEVVEQIRTAIESLSPQSPKVIKLLMQGLKHEEIADILDISITTVRTHKRIATEKLRILLRNCSFTGLCMIFKFFIFF